VNLSESIAGIPQRSATGKTRFLRDLFANSPISRATNADEFIPPVTSCYISTQRVDKISMQRAAFRQGLLAIFGVRKGAVSPVATVRAYLAQKGRV
jgi:hypothetical protein